jgi:hypothetical protein
VRFSKIYLYAVLAVAGAVAYGVGEGQYWVTDLEVFAVVVGAVAYLCFARGGRTKDTEPYYRALGVGAKDVYRPAELRSVVTEPDQREHLPRSRMAHYVIVSRTKSRTLTDWLRLESDSSFERTLFGEPGWRTLSGEDLEEIARKASNASTEGAQ